MILANVLPLLFTHVAGVQRQSTDIGIITTVQKIPDLVTAHVWHISAVFMREGYHLYG